MRVFSTFVEKEYLNASIYAADCSSAACVWDLWISATLLLLCSAFIQFFFAYVLFAQTVEHCCFSSVALDYCIHTQLCCFRHCCQKYPRPRLRPRQCQNLLHSSLRRSASMWELSKTTATAKIRPLLRRRRSSSTWCRFARPAAAGRRAEEGGLQGGRGQGREW